ncbi:Tetratricopeptide repeat protein 9A [Psilocybe cubensis]|uniref:Tetratricopeptide repeat protein 9A n=2 Tax=Psilocybe cubensis TaxID=181762 RepID=A0ACB8H102_PSICU|nr:Tetratricopeptide repeat protein 9A [Psilocybe cubensis]KAH9481583.1 Tetratricopeptide repeat protein 9A [Psilocybe cubensis]
MADSLSDVPSATAQKIAIAKQKKDAGDQAFKLGNVKDALKSYHEALMYLLGLDKNALQNISGPSRPADPASSDPTKGAAVKEKTEVDDILEKIYANMSACHLKNQNWRRAVETADKALAKNENNYKAMFRKGKGLGEQGFFEKALKILEDLKTKNPTDGPLVDQEIARLRAIDEERERVHKKKMKGFLNKAEKKGEALFNDDAAIPTENKGSFIEEVSD